MKKILPFIVAFLIQINSANAFVDYGACGVEPETLTSLEDRCGISYNMANIKCYWRTVTEVRNDYFIVYRSTDNNNWVPVSGQINSCGSCIDHYYDFWDNLFPVPGVEYYYKVVATSTWGNTNTLNLGSYFLPIPTSNDWSSQVANSVIIGSSSNNINDYNWSEQSNTIQGVSINLIPTEVMPIFLEQNNCKIFFNTSQTQFFTSLEIKIDDNDWISIYNGCSTTLYYWVPSSTLINCICQHKLSVKWLPAASSTYYLREYNVYVIPKSQKLYKDNMCNTIRMWESSDPLYGAPLLLSEGFDAYNTKPQQYYRKAGDELIECLLSNGINVYIINYSLNSQDIRNNAAVYASAIKYISSLNNYKKVIAAGISMGGVIARYAVTKQESEGHPLNVSKLLTMDSPHQGAIVSRELQDFKKEKTGNDLFASHFSDNPAAKQLLIYNAFDPHAVVHNNFYNEYNSLNGNGLPHLTENIAVSFSTNDPNPSSGDWLKVNLSLFGLPWEYKTFPLIDEEKVAGSYLPLLNIDQRVMYFIPEPLNPWYWSPLAHININNFGFLSQKVIEDQENFPTFIPYTSSLDIVNGQSKFYPNVIQPNNPNYHGFHDVVPPSVISAIVTKLKLDDFILQNEYITTQRQYYGKTITVKNIVIDNTQVQLVATEKINLQRPFKVKPISNLIAKRDNISFSCYNTDNYPMVKSENNFKDSIIYANYSLSKGFITVYPNPTIGPLKINIHNIISDLYNISIFNSIGKNVYSTKSSSNEIFLDLSCLSEGFYIIKVTTAENQIYTTKIIIQ